MVNQWTKPKLYQLTNEKELIGSKIDSTENRQTRKEGLAVPGS